MFYKKILKPNQIRLSNLQSNTKTLVGNVFVSFVLSETLYSEELQIHNKISNTITNRYRYRYRQVCFIQ